MKRSSIRIAAVLFVLFIICAVVIADRGEGDKWWAFVQHIPYGDKVGHIGLMGTLSFLCNLAFPTCFRKIPAHIATPTTLAIFTLVTLEELSQAFIPHRTCDLFDWLADITGILLGQTCALLIIRCRTAPSIN